MPEDQNNLTAALADVRRAYRLLWGYQKRVMDLNTTIRSTLGFRPYDMRYWFKPRNPPENWWGWENLPFYKLDFLSVMHQQELTLYPNQQWMNYPRIGDMLLVLHVTSDSGYPESPGRAEPDPTTFTDANESTSMIRVSVLINTTNRDQLDDWAYNWRNLYNAAKLPLSTGELSPHPNVPDVQCLGGPIFDLGDLGDSKAVMTAAEQIRSQVSGATNDG